MPPAHSDSADSQEVTAPKSPHYPWGMIAANVAGITGAHALGYLSAGALAKALDRSRWAGQLRNLRPEMKLSLIAQGIGLAGSIGTVAGSMAHVANQRRVAEEYARRQLEAQSAGNAKVAAVFEAYSAAMLEGR